MSAREPHEPEEPYQHGSTVLPGVPLPPRPQPHEPAAPAAVDAPAAAPPVEEAPAPAHGRHAAGAATPPAPAASAGGRRRVVLLGVLGLVVVLAAVAAFLWPGFLVSSDSDGESLAPTPTPTPSAAAVTLTTPDSVAGLRRFTGPADDTLAKSVAAAEVQGLSDPVSAVYGTGKTPKAQVIAWRAVSPPPADTVTAGFTGYESSTGADVAAVREVATPGLDGRMECGLATLAKNRTLQCFWADEVSVGSVTVLSVTDRAKATSTASAIRAAVEQTG